MGYLPCDLRYELSRFVLLVPDTGVRGDKHMKKKIRYTDEPLGKLKIISDFLPPIGQIALKERESKITLSLKQNSLAFFKKAATKHGQNYQDLITKLLDYYVDKQLAV